MRSQWIQACVTNVSFPTVLDGVRRMVRKNSALKADLLVDMDVLHAYDASTGYEWTCGPWMRRGDVILFYHAKGAPERVKHLGEAGIRNPIKEALVRSAQYASRYAGTIFAYGILADDAMQNGRYAAGNHFKTQTCAPCSAVCVLQKPITPEEWSPLVQIKRRAPVTPLTRQQAREFRHRMAGPETQHLELRLVRFGDPAFGRVGGKTWLRIAQEPSRFVYEHQVREYLAEPLLSELADRGYPVLSECRCFRNGRVAGVVDCCVRIRGRWLPVEIKLDVKRVPSHILDAQYRGVEACVPTLRPWRGRRIELAPSVPCLLLDRTGAYAVVQAKLDGCVAGNPRWPITDWGQRARDEISEWVSNHREATEGR